MYASTDLVLYGTRGGELEYDFEVAPGGDPKVITLHIDGASGLELSAGDSLVHTGSGSLRQARPQIYQEIDGRRRAVAGGFG